MSKVLFILTLMFSSQAMAFDVKTESEKREWLDRLFYEKGKSLVQSEKFFVSKEGRTNPKKELQTSIDLIHSDLEAFACKFPSRFEYLAPKLGVESKVRCPDFELWRDSFEASGVSLMFASQYLENPASAFGHTYLKITSAKKALYLNKVISFAAQVPEEIGAGKYVWKGLTGGFHGEFNVGPFYILFHEYANMEKRDIWEYELDLSLEQTKRLLSVLYEVVHHAKFDYMFLNNNCSSLLLKLLDIELQKNLMNELAYYVLPIETVKALDERRLIKNSVFHPSITSRMIAIGENLKRAELREAMTFIEERKGLDESSSGQTLDLGLEYLNFERQRNAGELRPYDKAHFNRLLLLRAQKPATDIPKPEGEDPIHTNDPQRISIGIQGISGEKSGLSLTYRPVGKDFLDRPHGFSRESEINFLRTKVFIGEESWMNLDVIGVRKFSDFNLITQSMSWGANLSVSSDVREGCPECYFVEVDSHYGIGKEIKNVISYVVFHPTVRNGNLEQNTNFLPGLEAGIIQSTDYFTWRLSANAGYLYNQLDWDRFNQAKFLFSWNFSKDINVGISGEHYERIKSWNTFETFLSFSY